MTSSLQIYVDYVFKRDTYKLFGHSDDSSAKVVEGSAGDWIFTVLPGAAVIHIFEEYVYPGGFPQAFSKLLPRAAHIFTPKFHLAVNSLFILLCLCSALIGKANPVLSLSVFGLIFANALLHIRGAIVTKRYYPGVISGVLIYIPLVIYAYGEFLSSNNISWFQAGHSCLLGIMYMGVLMVYILIQQVSHTGYPEEKV